MIVRCDHLRLIGILKHSCCPDCHGPAGCVGEHLPDGHRIIYCCARIDPLTDEEVDGVLAHIPKWEAIMKHPVYAQNLRDLLKKYQEKLEGAQEQGSRQQYIRDIQCTIKRFKQLLTDAGASLEK